MAGGEHERVAQKEIEHLTSVAFVSTFPPTRCGIAEYTRFLVSALNKTDIDIVILADKTDQPPTAYQHDGLLVIPAFNKDSQEYPQELLEKLEEVKPQIVHIEHEYFIYHRDERFIDLLKGIKNKKQFIVVTTHTTIHSASPDKKALAIQKKIGELADALIVHTVLQEFELISQGITPSKIWRIPHGSLLVELMPMNKAAKMLNLDISATTRIIASLGFIREDKGLEELVRAAAELTTAGQDYYFLIAGAVQVLGATTPQEGVIPQPLRDYLKEITSASEQVGDRLIFITRFLTHEEIRAVLSIADVIVMSYPIEFQEALYGSSGILHLTAGAGKPIVYTKTSRLVELFQVAPELVYNYGDSKELAQKIILALRDRKLRRKMKTALKRLSEETSWFKVALRHRELYSLLTLTGFEN